MSVTHFSSVKNMFLSFSEQSKGIFIQTVSAQQDTKRQTTALPIYQGQFKEEELFQGERYSLENVASNLLPQIAATAASLLAAVAMIYIILAGYQYLTAAGDTEKNLDATKTALYAVLGLILIIFSSAIVYLFLSFLSPQ